MAMTKANEAYISPDQLDIRRSEQAGITDKQTVRQLFPKVFTHTREELLHLMPELELTTALEQLVAKRALRVTEQGEYIPDANFLPLYQVAEFGRLRSDEKAVDTVLFAYSLSSQALLVRMRHLLHAQLFYPNMLESYVADIGDEYSRKGWLILQSGVFTPTGKMFPVSDIR